MKTAIIELLAKEPVKMMKQRVAMPNRLTVVSEESEVMVDTGIEQERYRFELRLGASFVNFPGSDWERSRHMQHKLLIRTVTEHIYSDVRHKLREMYPIVGELADAEAREDLFAAIEELLDMTVPE